MRDQRRRARWGNMGEQRDGKVHMKTSAEISFTYRSLQARRNNFGCKKVALAQAIPSCFFCFEEHATPEFATRSHKQIGKFLNAMRKSKAIDVTEKKGVIHVSKVAPSSAFLHGLTPFFLQSIHFNLLTARSDLAQFRLKCVGWLLASCNALALHPWLHLRWNMPRIETTKYLQLWRRSSWCAQCIGYHVYHG